jgi:hypothetical protein
MYLVTYVSQLHSVCIQILLRVPYSEKGSVCDHPRNKWKIHYIYIYMCVCVCVCIKGAGVAQLVQRQSFELDSPWFKSQ